MSLRNRNDLQETEKSFKAHKRSLRNPKSRLQSPEGLMKVKWSFENPSFLWSFWNPKSLLVGSSLGGGVLFWEGFKDENWKKTEKSNKLVAALLHQADCTSIRLHHHHFHQHHHHRHLHHDFTRLIDFLVLTHEPAVNKSNLVSRPDVTKTF